MGLVNWLVSLLPLLIPVAVWALLNQRDRQGRARPDEGDDGDAVPRLVPTVAAFSAGGAIKASARGPASTLVQDVLLGAHECVLFAYVEELHGRGRPWGDVLDAGTGAHSLGWMAALDSASLTAVTGDPYMMSEMQRLFRGKLRPGRDELVIGNWGDDDFLRGRMYDVIVADYLLGALEGFAPYHQHRLLGRLKRHLRPGGALYLVGTEPLPARAPQGVSSGEQLLCDVARTRDALILLGGDRRRPYREYPAAWVLEHAKPIFRPAGAGAFPINHSARTVSRQLGVAKRKLPFVDPLARAGLAAMIDGLEARVATTDWSAVHLGEDYVLAFRLPEDEDVHPTAKESDTLKEGDKEEAH